MCEFAAVLWLGVRQVVRMVTSRRIPAMCQIWRRVNLGDCGKLEKLSEYRFYVSSEDIV